MRYTLCLLLLSAGVAGLSWGVAHAEGDAARGKTKFNRCSACHSIDGRTRAGPTLQGVFGRTAGTLEGFRYSPAMVASKVVWDDATLESYLAGPTRMMRGTRMTIAVPKAEDRADIIAYVKTLAAQ